MRLMDKERRKEGCARVHGGKRVTSVQCMVIELVVASGNIPQLGHFMYNGVLLTLPTSHFADSHFAYLGA